jgi:hypothetical protein
MGAVGARLQKRRGRAGRALVMGDPTSGLHLRLW